jgi:ABC-type branched-subunit amino acid transport system substrate-binding protein
VLRGRDGLRTAAGGFVLILLLASCALPIDAAPVVKLGVIAPFEGAGRNLGYAILPEIKAAAAEANASGALAPYRVLVVAFNDNLDPPTARQQAAALALDPDVVGVVGPFSEETSAAALPVLAAASVPAAPVTAAQWTGSDFSQEQRAAKEAARSLLQDLAAQIRATGRPTRTAISYR